MEMFKGWLYCLLWYSSILAGYAGLFCPLLPILFISNKLYRRCTDTLFTFWQYYPTVLLERLCGCDIQITGDMINASETSLLVMNHRTRTDWNFLWPTVYHSVGGKGRYSHSTKFVLKDIIRHIPGPGWVMQLACFVYIKRNWFQDKVTFRNTVNYFTDLKYKFSLIVFPEGTDLTPATKRHSDNYAMRNNLQLYDYVLHPRTTGFVYLVKKLLRNGCLDAIYDMTLVYPDTVPQNEMVMLRGNFPKRIKIHLSRYRADELPQSEDGLRSFLESVWFNKERVLNEFYMTGRFFPGQYLTNPRRHFELNVALVFWTCLPLLVLYFFIVYHWFRLIVVMHTIFIVLLNFFFDGFQKFEMDLYNFKKKFHL